MDQAIESNLWRILVLVILLTRLQASTGCSRRGPPTAPPKFGQSESGIHNVFIFSGMLSGLIKRELKPSQVILR